MLQIPPKQHVIILVVSQEYFLYLIIKFTAFFFIKPNVEFFRKIFPYMYSKIMEKDSNAFKNTVVQTQDKYLGHD